MFSDHPLALLPAEELARALARRLRDLRIVKGWTQAELAARAGVALPTYRRFERSGEIALVALLRLVIIVGRVDRLDALFAAEPVQSLDQLLAQPKQRQRASRRKVA